MFHIFYPPPAVMAGRGVLIKLQINHAKLIYFYPTDIRDWIFLTISIEIFQRNDKLKAGTYILGIQVPAESNLIKIRSHICYTNSISWEQIKGYNFFKIAQKSFHLETAGVYGLDFHYPLLPLLLVIFHGHVALKSYFSKPII